MTAKCRATLDRSKCSGIGLCEMTAPDVFEVADDGQARVLMVEVDITRRAQLEEAASNCPTESITVTIVN